MGDLQRGRRRGHTPATRCCGRRPICAGGVRTGDGLCYQEKGSAHEKESAGEADGLVVSADDGAVDAVRELVDILRKNTCLERRLSIDTTTADIHATHSRGYSVVGCVFRAAFRLKLGVMG